MLVGGWGFAGGRGLLKVHSHLVLGTLVFEFLISILVI
jgi:hypothetical protein